MPFSATDLLGELPRLRRYARILTGDAELADRLVEETLLRCREMPADTAPASTGSTRLLALLRAVSAEHAASGTLAAPPFPGRSTSIAGENASAAPSPDHGAEILAQLRELPLEQREVLVLVAVERMSYTDIAALLQMPVATVMSRLSQARAALRSIPRQPLSAPKNAG
jgi:RNA polymerase sigma-70 factor (ECF subfamily)